MSEHRKLRRAIIHSTVALTELLDAIGRKDMADALLDLLERSFLSPDSAERARSSGHACLRIGEQAAGVPGPSRRKGGDIVWRS